MRVLAVDDEALGLSALKDAIIKADPTLEIFPFDYSLDALEFVKSNAIDIAFLDIFMAEMDGIELAKQIKLVSPKTHIVFTTGFDDYMKDAFQLHANGYVMKPITPEKIKVELDNIKLYDENIGAGGQGESQKSKSDSGKRLRFQCFGSFEVFCDGKPLHFKYDRTKEMLAYIVSRRGALCSNGEIIINLWEDDNGHDSYLRGIRKDMIDVFKELGLSGIINQQRGKIGIDIEQVSCDYYDFLNGDVQALNKYTGEFMSQYSWSEFINGEMSL